MSDKNCESDPKGITYSGYAEAFSILSKYSEEKWGVCSIHDEIFATLSLEKFKKMPEDDKNRLQQLGWRYDHIDECFIKYT